MGAEAAKLPRIDFSGVDPSAPGSGRWAAVCAQVMDALATSGCLDAHYPELTPELRASLFDGAVRPLFSLPGDVKRRNTCGPGKPFHGYLGGLPGLDAYESLAIVDGPKPDPVRAFADLMFHATAAGRQGGASAGAPALGRAAQRRLGERRSHGPEGRRGRSGGGEAGRCGGVGAAGRSVGDGGGAAQRRLGER